MSAPYPDLALARLLLGAFRQAVPGDYFGRSVVIIEEASFKNVLSQIDDALDAHEKALAKDPITELSKVVVENFWGGGIPGLDVCTCMFCEENKEDSYKLLKQAKGSLQQKGLR